MTHDVKAASSPSAEEALRLFEAFKDANDERLAAIAAKRPDPLLEDRVARIESALQRVETKAERAERAGVVGLRPGVGADPAEPAHKSAWAAYLRRGDESQMAALELKALSAGSPTDGGYISPPDLDRRIEKRLQESSPMRQIATVRTTGATIFRRIFSTTAAGAGWAAETAGRPQGATPTLSMIEATTFELFANLAATQTLLDDAYVDVEEWIASECEEAFSGQERAVFVNGDGVGKPKGFLAYPVVADASQGWGQLGYLATGVAGGFPTTAPVEKLIDLIFAPKAIYRQNARFVMNRRTLAAVRKLKDQNNAYIWRPADAAGDSTVLGYPVTEIEDMPNIATDTMAIAFGDFQRGYLIVDRAGVRVLRDPYSAKPYVLFYVTKRVGGAVQNFDAIKLLKFGAS